MAKDNNLTIYPEGIREIENPAERVSAYMKKLIEDRSAEIKEINDHINQLYLKRADNEDKLKAAMENTELDKYSKAEEELKKIETALRMYESRRNQIQKREFITEAESDQIIDDLLRYEERLGTIFQDNIIDHLSILKVEVKKYKDEVRSIESLIKEWTFNIHANYNTRGSSMYLDPETKEMTTRSPMPIDVHRIKFEGTVLSNIIDHFLKRSEIKKALDNE